MSDIGLLARQVVYTNKAFWRNPASAFFTFVFPLLFLVIFTTLLGNGEVPIGTEVIKTSTYYVAAQGAFGLISACFTNVALLIVFARDKGVLKRIRGGYDGRGVWVARSSDEVTEVQPAGGPIAVPMPKTACDVPMDRPRSPGGAAVYRALAVTAFGTVATA